MPGVCHLVMVTDVNNNKYYTMEDQGNGTFLATWGRIGATKTTKVYPISKWESLRYQKINKGYTDHTHLFQTRTVKRDFVPVSEPAIQNLLDELSKFTSAHISESYTVSVDNVTQAQVDEAQAIVDEMAEESKTNGQHGMPTNKGVDWFNERLTRLFRVIPRRMGRVQDYLLSYGDDHNRIRQIIDSEQSTLDSMASKVVQNVVIDDAQPQQQITMLELMGIDMELLQPGDEEHIKRLLGDESHRYHSAFRVTHKKTRTAFEEWVKEVPDKKVEQFWHGSRNQNWVGILQTGLRIRPSGAIYTGSMFGDGIYFADLAKKSLGYTSLNGSYWAHGNSAVGFMAIFDVHVGKQMIMETSDWNLTWQRVSGAGYDSVFAKKGKALYNNEYIVYHPAQCSVKYIVRLRG